MWQKYPCEVVGDGMKYICSTDSLEVVVEDSDDEEQAGVGD